jgi:nucleoside-diphosphate-sugar epimerase
MKRVVVTGPRGFIAGWLLDQLDGGTVLIDKGDYSHPRRSQWQRSLPEYDAVVHLGAVAGIKPSLSTNDYFILNVQRTVELLQAAAEAGVFRFIFASTSSLSHGGPNNIYDTTKFQAEYWCKTFREKIPDVVILRIYNVYGPGDVKGVIPKFAQALRKHETITIHGDGNQVRDFVHVSDVVAAIRKVLSQKDPWNTTLHVGTGKGTTVLELLRLMCDKTGAKPDMVPAPLPFPQVREAVCRKPFLDDGTLDLEKGLEAYIESLDMCVHCGRPPTLFRNGYPFCSEACVAKYADRRARMRPPR